MGSSLLKHLTARTGSLMALPPRWDLPPLTQHDGWKRGRFGGGRGGKRRYWCEIGGGCHCPCTRPGDSVEAEDEEAGEVAFLLRMRGLHAAGLQHCECVRCGKWVSGPLRRGEVRRIWVCCNIPDRGDRFCEDCGLDRIRWPHGWRTVLAAG